MKHRFHHLICLVVTFAIVICGFSFSTYAASSTLKKGNSGSEVKLLQNNLKKLGYFSGPATGVFGSITEIAVKDFQKYNGLTSDGVAGAKTLSLINSAASKSGTSKISSSVNGRTDIVLKLGSSGKDVKDLQKALKSFGYLNAQVTGNYGSLTRAAVKAFQKDSGFIDDGIAGSKTLKAIYKSSGKVALSVGSSDSSSSSSLKQGDESSSVRRLQKELKEKGYFSGEVTGYYGNITAEAVEKFQKKIGLTADGIAGPRTLAKLYGDSEPIEPESTVELADWYSTIKTVFSRGENAILIDVKTKKSLKIHRYGGHNHADVEPLDKDDTAILKDIYGGSWSWDRRAVWIKVDGRVFADSMNGMPHGGQDINYNNFQGQFCVHFLNSRTHNSGSVDSGHQSCIQYAYNHRDELN